MPSHRTTANASSTLRVGEVDVQVTRKRVRNINLRVKRDGTVCVSAPTHVSQSQIVAFVSSRVAWIETARARLLQQRQTTDVRCEEGAEVLLWGTTLVCHVEEVASMRRRAASFSVSGNRLVVRTGPSDAADPDTVLARRTKHLKAWLAGQLRAEGESLLPGIEETVGARCQGLRFRAMKSRWGSCNVSTGMITLNTQLVHFDRRCLAYVLIHELCHLHEPSHNARFHALMDRFCPDWRQVRALLNGRSE